jgi:succinate dehydrogenase hydrophobic anchor subunit
MMTPDAYFTWILLILTGLIFIALVLGFLYLVYGKEESSEEEA